MGTLIWVLHGLLAFVFIGAGAVKLMKSRPQLAAMGMGYVEDFTDGQIRIIGVLELLGGVGVILPVAIQVMPILSGAAAAGLLLTMVGAAATHAKRGEYPNIVVNVILGGIAGYVASLYLL